MPRTDAAASHLDDVAIRLSPDDNVAVARHALNRGEVLVWEGRALTLQSDIPAGHKLALADVAPGESVTKYRQTVGLATTPIAPGDHVHVHNVTVGEHPIARAISGDGHDPAPAQDEGGRTFDGFVRAPGRVATRNYIGILTSVNCSATAARQIADRFQGAGALADYPNVDGIVALTHQTGCGLAIDGTDHQALQRTIGGYARHPNFAGFVLLGLGCETNRIPELLEAETVEVGAMARVMTIQDEGGTARTVRAGLEAIEEMLPVANVARRQPVALDHLSLGLQCGASDGYSGLTANPVLGVAADMVVRHGGTAALAETPEIYGAEHLLLRRAVDRSVADKLVARIRWWEDYSRRNDAVLDNNPSPGNRDGGLTTILEKSLGAVMKSGSSKLVDVYEYAEAIRSKGLVFMDTPGYDPVSVTGLVAGGVNLVGFTTGRGSVFGCKPVPSLKIATNTAMYERMVDDMDFNAGTVLDGQETVEEAGRRLFELLVAVASGARTKSEELGFGDEEFVPWQMGAVL